MPSPGRGSSRPSTSPPSPGASGRCSPGCWGWSGCPGGIEGTPGPIYDYIYLDGAHVFLHDALAFFLSDRLLKVGGCIDFDDYFWSVEGSKWMAERRHEYMTNEQIEAQQVKLVIDNLVAANRRYEEVTPHKVFRKIA